jgi:MFS family permease
LLIQPLAGYLADKVQIRTTVLIGLLIAAFAIGPVTFTFGVVLIAITILAGVGVVTVWMNTDTLVTSLAEQNKLGARHGCRAIVQGVRRYGGAAPGRRAYPIGVRVGFVACGVLALLCLAVLARSNAGRA